MPDNVNERQKREKIISGEATTRKKTGIAKMSDIFVAEDIQTVKTRMFMDVLVPSLKDVIANMVISGVQMILFGDSGRRNRAPGARYDYGGYYNSLNQQQKTQKADYSYGYNDPVVNSRGDAERILQEMAEIIGEYGKASIADLYDLCGITGRPTDMNYGWTEMPGARPVRIPDGYLIQMPRPVCIK